MEEKRLGDMAVTEGWAMLMQHLTDEPGWLSRKLDFPRPDEYAAEGMLWLLFFVRRYSAKLLYELEFHAADDISGMPKRYVGAARRRAQVRDQRGELPRRHRLRLLRHGVPALLGVRVASCATTCASASATTGSPSARPGSLLRELWSLGQKPTADELLKDVTGAEIQMSAVGDRVREHLA